MEVEYVVLGRVDVNWMEVERVVVERVKVDWVEVEWVEVECIEVGRVEVKGWKLSGWKLRGSHVTPMDPEDNIKLPIIAVSMITAQILLSTDCQGSFSNKLK